MFDGADFYKEALWQRVFSNSYLALESGEDDAMMQLQGILN